MGKAGVVATPDLPELLRAAGLRVTRPRLAVIAAVRKNPHASTEVIIDHVRSELQSVSHQAVYDCLNALTAAGLLRRIQPADRSPGTRPGPATTTTTLSAAGVARSRT